jgi:hypothetical protein
MKQVECVECLDEIYSDEKVYVYMDEMFCSKSCIHDFVEKDIKSGLLKEVQE